MEKKMKKYLLALPLILLSMNSWAARTDCPKAKILNIQIEGQKVVYLQEGGAWRTLGWFNNEDGTRERYSAMLAAQASGKSVHVGYPDDDYECGSSNYGTSAYLLRTYN